MATQGVRNIFDYVAGIVLKIPLSEVSAEDQVVAHRLVNSAWEGGAGAFITAACAHWGERYHIPSLDQMNEIDGLIQLWVRYSNGAKDLSHTGLTMSHGIWDHFKGGVYLSQRVGVFASGNDEPMIEYLSMVFGTTHFRLCWEWNEVVMWPDGKYRSRFVYRGKDLREPPPPFKAPTPRLPYEVATP